MRTENHINSSIAETRTVKELLCRMEALLGKHSINEARRKSELLLAHYCDCRPLQLYTRPEDILSDQQLTQVQKGLERLIGHEPIQYITGTVDFFNCVLNVDRRALIPRPETELLVELVLATDELWEIPSPMLADAGTGTGCIPIALCLEHPDAKYTGIDLFADPLELARENAKLNGIETRITWQQNDLLNGFEPESLHAITANLPYISEEDYKQLPDEIRLYEPITALTAGSDGLDLIRKLTRQAAQTLKSGGWIFLEIGAAQAQDVQTLMRQHNFTRVSANKDLAGLDRIVWGMKP